MNPSGSEFTLRVAICDLVERLKRMQHKCSYLEECRNQLVKEVIRLRIQNEWLAKQMHDTPSGSAAGPPVTGTGTVPAPAQCFCNIAGNGSGSAQQMSQHHHSSLVNSSSVAGASAGGQTVSAPSQPSNLQHQPSCPFALVSGSESAAAAAASAAAVHLAGDTSGMAAAYFINGDNSEQLNASTTISGSQRTGAAIVNSTSGVATNNNTVSDESLHLMNILNQFEQEDNNASKENSIKNLTLQMLKELETEMRTGKLKSDLLKLVNTGSPKKNSNASNGTENILAYDETPGNSKQSRGQDFGNNNNNNNNHHHHHNNNNGTDNGLDKSLDSLEDSGTFGRSKSKPETGSGWSGSGGGGGGVNSDADRNNKMITGSRSTVDCIDLTALLNEDELMSLVSMIRRDIRTLQADVHSSTERLSKIKQKNEDEKFRFYFQKQIKSEPGSATTAPASSSSTMGTTAATATTTINNQSSISQPNTGQTGALSVSVTGTGNTASNLERNGALAGVLQSGNNHKANLKHS